MPKVIDETDRGGADVLWITDYSDDQKDPMPVYTEHIVLKKRIPKAAPIAPTADRQEPIRMEPQVFGDRPPVRTEPPPVEKRPPVHREPVEPRGRDEEPPARPRSREQALQFHDSIGRMASEVCRSKPSYADCWLVGTPESLESPVSYDMPFGHVIIGRAADGETEYNLTPFEYTYSDSLNAVVSKTIGGVRNIYRRSGGRMDRHSIVSTAKGVLMDSSDTLEAVIGSEASAVDKVICEMAEVVYRYTVGLGVFEVLLADPKLEDIYIDAPCDRNRIHVTMNGLTGANSHLRCRTNLMVNRREVQNLIGVLKRDSGLPFCQSNPILETDMKMHDARATVVGYPMSPNGDAVAIRKHSVRPWTLARLIANGTLDAETAGLLSFLVDNRSTFLICGARGAGKSSLLSAMMFEFPVSQRILTIEDTIELPGEKMRRMGYKVQSMLIDDRRNGDSQKRADEALRVSLRMGESAIVLGEVRGEEAKTLYQSMRTGRAGSSIMGTIHGDSARTVYERVIHDMQIAPEAFMATDVLVTLGTKKDRGNGSQVRGVNEIVATADRTGEFIDISGPGKVFLSPVMRRIQALTGLSRADIQDEITVRGELRRFLASMGDKYGDEYCGPEWICLANEHVAREAQAGNTHPGRVVESFRRKFARSSGMEV
jgi:archaeal flagellar protein FlaI